MISDILHSDIVSGIALIAGAFLALLVVGSAIGVGLLAATRIGSDDPNNIDGWRLDE